MKCTTVPQSQYSDLTRFKKGVLEMLNHIRCLVRSYLIKPPRVLNAGCLLRREMLTCRAFYGLLICHFSCNFQFYGLMSLLPQYLSNVLNFDISLNGFLTSLPWLCSWISTWVICGVTDYLRGQKGSL